MTSSKKIILVFLIALLPGAVFGATYLQDNFDGYADSPTNHGWTLPASFSVVSGNSPDGGRAIMCTVSGGGLYNGGLDPCPSGVFNDGYIGFWVKIVGQAQGAAGGSKFLKLFSDDYFTSGGTTAANTTFAQTYNTGLHRDINHGNGSTTANDTQQYFSYDGNKTAGAVGTITDYAGSFYLQDGEWHWWECKAKLNTDDNSDGAYAVWIDGVQKINVINVKNRHNDNTRDWSLMHFIGWIEAGATPETEYYVYIDRVTTSDAYMGPPSAAVSSCDGCTTVGGSIQ